MIVKNVEKKENQITEFTIESTPEEFEGAVNTAYRKNKGSINIPGFRKGKAPRAVIEGMYGAEVFYQDAIDELIESAFMFGVDENKFRIVGTPAVKAADITDGKTVVYTFAITEYPVATLGQYKGLEATKTPFTVTDEDVEKEIKADLERNARVVSIDRPAQMGDTANIDFEGFLNGEPFEGGKSDGYSLQLGSGSFVPGFEEQIVGMQAGDEKEINITFPEQYTEELAGKDVVFKVKVNELTVKETEELSDDFVQDISEFDTVDEYRADVRKTLEKHAEEKQENEVRAQLMKLAVDNMTCEIPEALYQEKTEQLVRRYAANYGMEDRNVEYKDLLENLGLTEDMVKTTVRPAAEAEVQQDLLLEAIIAAENIEVSDEEIDAYAEKTSKEMNVDAETIKKYFGNEFIVDQEKREKAFRVLVDNAVITEKAAETEEKTEEAAE